MSSAQLCRHSLIAVAWIIYSAGTTLGQVAARPDRGIVNMGSYTVSDIETINVTSGNVHLSLPLANLAPIAGGKLSAAIVASYDSKLWDARIEERKDHPMEPIYTAKLPQRSPNGGWKIGGAYSIQTSLSTDDYDYIQTDGDPDHAVTWFKVSLVTPDGTTHELRPLDYLPYQGNHEYLRGYFRDSANNTGNSALRYYSFDGSFLWAKLYPDQASTLWEIYLPDGTKVIQSSSGEQRIIDTNNNSIRIFTDGGAGLTTTHYQDEQTSREIKIVYDPTGNNAQGSAQVLYQTVNGVWEAIDIEFGTTVVSGKVFDVQGNYCIYQDAVVATEIPVIREIILPETEPGIQRHKFSFVYNSDHSDADPVYWQPSPQCSVPQVFTNSPSHGWGSLSQMTMPQGAMVNYSYSLDGSHDVEADMAAAETVTMKTLTHDGNVEAWSFNITSSGNTTTAPDGSVTTEDFFFHSPGYSSIVGGSNGLAGLVYRSNKSSKILTERHWVRMPFAGAQENAPGSLLVFNAVVDAEYTSLLDDTTSHNALKMSAKTYQYDFNGNLLQQTDYDWFNPQLVQRDASGVPTGVPGDARVLRVTTNDYYNPATSSSSANVYAKRSLTTGMPLILSALQKTKTEAATTQFSYDGQAYGTAPTVGNLTSQSSWDNLDNKWITTSQTYGSYGNLATKTDARGNVTQLFYDDLSRALPTRVVVDPQNGTGPQTWATVFDFWTGLVTRSQDPNENVSIIEYINQLTGTVDPFGRPAVSIGPVVNLNGTNQGRRRVTTTYRDSEHKMTVAADLNVENDQLLKTSTTTDQLGRVILTEHAEDGINYNIYSLNSYHQMGKITFSSNPRRYDSSTTTTDGWTRVTKDNAGRVTEVATFGSWYQPPLVGTNSNWTGTVTTTYNANRVTVQDQTGKERSSVSDSLGRLIEVYEDPNGANYLTSYSYDPLGNLLQVNQGAQSRTFNYDSLSRLRSATNPESGTVSYSYNDNGNLTQKTDARGVVANYAYDALNRNTTVSFLNDPSGTLPVTRVYDQAVKGKGRLYQSQTTGASGSLTTIDTYDAMGQPLTQRQQFYVNGDWSQSYTTQRSYILAGSVNSETYPSGSIVNYSYDYAGRTKSFTGTLGDGVSRNYSTAILYSPAGSMTKEKLGTDTAIYNNLTYNSRGQLSEIRASTSYTGPADPNWDRGKFVNWYSQQCGGPACNNSDNNGNLRKQETFIPHNDQVNSTSWRQEFDYDNLSRLSRVKEFDSGSAQLWQQEYNYDRWGNRTIHQTNTWGSGIPKLNFAVNTTINDNRLTAPPGYTMSYDPAGNLINDTYTGEGERIYDAENRMTKAWANNRWQVYTFNADGRRVRRKVNDIEIWQVYGMDGELLAEYPANGAVTDPQKEYGYRNGQMLISAEPALPPPSPTPTPGTISRIGDATNSALGQTINVSKPAGVALGDVLIAVISSSFAYGGVPTPAGWTPVRSIDQGSQIIHVDTYYRVVDGNEPANWTWQLGSPTGNVNSRATATIVAYRGVNTTIPIGESNVWCCDAGTTTTVNSIWTTTPNNLVLAIFAEGMSNNTYILPGGWTSVSAVTNGDPDWGNHHVVSEKLFEPAGATGDQTATNGKDTGSDAALLIALRPGSSSPPANYVAFRDFSSVQGQGNWYYLSSSGASINFIASTNQWKDEHEDYGLLWSWGGHPGENADMVRQWRASTSGTVRITGNAYDAHAGCGDGVVVSIKKGTQLLWQQTIDDGNAAGFNFDVTTAVVPGDELNFVINKRSANNSCDSTFFNPKITYKVANINWMVTDQLGTPRMIFDKSGSLTNVKRHDYLPFGEELGLVGGRITEQGYSASDGVRQKFTDKERDGETGLDYFINRYYSSTQGRFTSPDPTLLSVNGFNPQTWNRYTYVMNNPLAFVDPLGLWALQSETVYKTDKDGNQLHDKKGRLIVDHVNVTAVRTSKNDTAASLAKQLGLTGKAANSLANKVGGGDNVRLSRTGGDVGRIFGAVESGLKEQAQFEIEHPGSQGQGPNSADCSETACRVAFPQQMFGTLTFSVQEADATISAENATTSAQESALRLGDIVRWADAKNNPKHFASFIFRNDDGVPVVFSKSGARGPYETPTTTEIGTKYPGYGTIRGISSGQTGYYHPR